MPGLHKIVKLFTFKVIECTWAESFRKGETMENVFHNAFYWGGHCEVFWDAFEIDFKL